jgi:hypothetical protein
LSHDPLELRLPSSWGYRCVPLVSGSEPVVMSSSSDCLWMSLGKPVKLSLAAEEVATLYGKMLHQEYTTKEVFQNNFFNDWRKVCVTSGCSSCPGPSWPSHSGAVVPSQLPSLQSFSPTVTEGLPGIACAKAAEGAGSGAVQRTGHSSHRRGWRRPEGHFLPRKTST